MKRSTSWIGCLLALAVGAANVRAADVDKSDSARELQKANRLIGITVNDAQGQKLGKIEDIVLNTQRNRVSYAVLSFGGILERNKFFAIPWAAMRMAPGGEAMILAVDRQKLETAPGFDRDQWPDMGDPQWAREVASHYGQEPESYGGADKQARRGEEAQEPRRHFWARRLSKLVGVEVRNRQNQSLGEIEDVVLHTPENQIAYAIVSVDTRGVTLRQKLAAVPWQALKLRPQLGTAVLEADRDSLEAIAFEEDQYPDLSDRQYGQKLHERFDLDPFWEKLGIERQDDAPAPSIWAAGSEYNRRFDPQKMTTLEGTVSSVGTFEPEAGAPQGLRLRVKTDKDTWTVHVGPESYVLDEEAQFYYGDRVTVTGSQVRYGVRTILMATQIRKGDETLKLRDEQGTPAWEMEDVR